MKYYLPAIFALSIMGCSNNSYHDELAVEIVTEKLHKNGPHLFCDQSGYSACFDITQEQCLTEMNDISIKCIKKSDGKFGKTSMSNMDIYSEYYAACVVMEHILKYPDTMDEIASCVENLSYDEKQGTRSLLK
ncbi:hypothetical protein [Photobacterium kasasachensis]|uniref:hypothetical protein n=1 Tax=Photobacterium kasasachensis TaxID=2910240 RepID=UPI003D152683